MQLGRHQSFPYSLGCGFLLAQSAMLCDETLQFLIENKMVANGRILSESAL